MKKKIVVLIVLIMASVAGVVEAAEEWWTPVSVEVYEIQTGHYCVTDHRDDGPHTKCYCPCELGMCAEPSEEPKETPTTPEPPVPTEKPSCNSGRGNGSEGDPDCDPGNSGGHNQGGD